MENFSSLLTHSIFTTVAKAAVELNIDTYVVGGFVRDLLLKRSSKDIDFVCVGSGVSLAEKVQSILGEEAHLSVYQNFGTASIHFEDHVFEFVGARKESYRSSSRNPIVEEGTLEDDQNRRDFTINAMTIALNENNYGTLVDPFGGVKDLAERVLKTPLAPTKTFLDDPLRMMRAIRFATQLGFDIEADTFQAICESKERLKIISQERITDELNKIILSETPSYGFKLLLHSGLLELIFPEMIDLKGVNIIDGKGHKDNFYHTLKVLDNISNHTDSLWLRWAAILHDIAKPATARFHKVQGWTFHGHEDLGARWVAGIFKKMRLPSDNRMKYVRKLVRLHLRPIALVNSSVTDSAIRRLIFEAGDSIGDLMTLCRADITSKNPDKIKKYLSNFEKVEQKIKEVEERDRLQQFQPPISGEEIIDSFNIPPGREIGQIKSAIKEAILDGVIQNNREEAHQMMIELGKEMGLEVANTIEKS